MKKAVVSFSKSIPTILATLLLVSLIMVSVPPAMYRKVFIGDPLRDTLVGALVGSVSAGNPVNSYVIGGELLKAGVSLLAVTAFILAWVTVGIIQLPAEAKILGKRFAILRNALSFIFAILLAIITVAMVGA